ncbi:antibiotic biosynthesis monooxygenase [Streptomyces sp. A3M-1-3]|uniref:antibiotic biosynthesis monooxygenase n=1 Tax=Streptomyces sp. A3M-1-3 TaxID=2962044 RepID=UPI0020B804AD|nr:antibiotic biosynthesis monooxygenase [Streptomyces sp. A3M-1-3]MCP3822834.1 antibiotic biosynthesis monooxygenase [Streptomyces sp. A3M-1-3]
MTAQAAFNTLPDLTRSGAGTVMSSTWSVGTPERQRAAVDAIAEAWRSRPWPSGDLLSYTVYTGNDGDTLLHYSQWTSAAAHAEFARLHRDDRVADIDAAVPGIKRLGLGEYEPYRSITAPPGDTRVPGTVVIVDVEFDGPDPARQRAWIEAVFEALDTDPHPHPGGISGHFHVSTDGTRVLNYAEWESEQAHIEALAAPGDGVGSVTPQWQRVHNFPGVTGGGVNRYTPTLRLTPA